MAKASRAPGGVAAAVERLAAPVAQQLGLELWDVRFEKEGPDWFLRVLADKPGGPMDIDTCEMLSRAIDPLLDEADFIEQSYYLEVGSPGLGRRLTKPAHFDACMGQKIAVHLIRPDDTGRRDYDGVLSAAADGRFTIDTAGGPREFSAAAAGFVKLCDDEDLFH